eukprot:1190853-Prorocentrum_minimum.AAC.3
MSVSSPNAAYFEDSLTADRQNYRNSDCYLLTKGASGNSLTARGGTESSRRAGVTKASPQRRRRRYASVTAAAAQALRKCHRSGGAGVTQ